MTKLPWKLLVASLIFEFVFGLPIVANIMMTVTICFGAIATFSMISQGEV